VGLNFVAMPAIRARSAAGVIFSRSRIVRDFGQAEQRIAAAKFFAARVSSGEEQ
jgi:hypothetical protein